MRQNDRLFIELLNKVRVGNIDDDVKKLLKARFIYEPNKNCLKYILVMYAKNEPLIKNCSK